MKKLVSFFLYWLLRFGLSLRYRIQVKGLETLTPDTLSKPGGTLFLANHPAEVDPAILLSIFWPRFKPHPVAIDYLFMKKGVRFLLDFIGALPVPDFEESANSYKRLEIEKTYQKIFAYLHNKESLLIYPAGALKSQAEEYIGGTSGVHYIIEKEPDTNVILVRSTGLWGSSFSRAPTGKSPDIVAIFFQGIKTLLKNGIFFTPRRNVLIECTPAPEDFPLKGSRRELNQYLEEWYNAKGPEPLNLVSFSRWRRKVPQIYVKPPFEHVSYEEIPKEVQDKVVEEIKHLMRHPADTIEPDMFLAIDLGLDSLDMAQLVIMLKEEFGVSDVHSTEMKTVGSVMAFAAGLKKGERDAEMAKQQQLTPWEPEEKRPPPHSAEGKTILEAFFRTCEKMKDAIACSDHISGEVSYKKMKRAVIVLARSLSRFPEKRLGIMLPASVAVNAVILAAMLAKKIPVMINWTLGPRNLKSVVEQSGIQTTISSWNFLDRLESVELNGIDEQIVLLEEIRRKLPVKDRIGGLFLSFLGAQRILRAFKCDHIKEEDQAAILFTSGTESYPKGVPLSHRNLLFNQRGAYQMANIKKEDILLGALPSFHSFGFSVTGLMPLISGIRAVYSPDPTDGRRLATAISHWKATLLCLAPTFLKYLLKAASKDQLRSLRLVVLGAEKTPEKLYQDMAGMCEEAVISEGYGITECGPILTLNPPEKPRKGVGIPLPGVEILIVHPESHKPMETNQAGLILARGPNIFSGYLDPKLDRPFLKVKGQEWYDTGDLGYLNAEGYLTLEGRLKRFIKVGGEMISLNSIEEVLLSASQAHGWEIKPDAPSLAICTVEGEGKKSEIHLFTTFSASLEEINDELRNQGMSNLVRISSIKQMNMIPVLGTGKIDYRALKERLEEKGKK